eukprot:4964041-Amphidinium_carterae.1
MATIEQIQELVGRIQAVEAREADGITRERALEAQVQNLTLQLTTQQTQQGTTSGGGPHTSGVGAIDTRALGKPE